MAYYTLPGNGNSVAMMPQQPVIISSTGINHHQFPRLKVDSVRTSSIIEILLGVAFVVIQIASLVVLPASSMGYGICAGIFYITAGSVGGDAAHRRTHSLLVATIIMGSFSIVVSIAAFVLSGMAAVTFGLFIEYVNYNNYYCPECYTLHGLEWTLFAISIASFINSIVLVTMTSIGLCSKTQQNNQILSQQLMYPINNGGNGQPTVLVQQPQFSQIQMQPAPSNGDYAKF